MAKSDAGDQVRRRELISLVDCCNRDDYVFSDCPSIVIPLGQPCDAWSKLVTCDAKIAQIEEELIHLHRSRILLKEKVNRSHDKLLGTIPAEVVSQIFGFYVQLLRKESNIQTILLTLAGVSKAWRDLVFNTPQFWKTITVYIDHDLCNDRESRVQSLQTWLSRSAWTTLSISLEFSNIKGGNPLIPHPLLEMVVACADRWKHLSLSLEDDHHCEAVIKDQKLPTVRQLESLKIELYNSEIGPNLNSFLQQMQYLKRFKITHLHSLSDIHLTWSALTHLKIGVLPRNLFLRVLGSAPSLIQCKIGLIHDHYGRPQIAKHSSPVIVHSHLQRLHIEHLESPSSQEIHFDMLVLPFLTDFSYRAHYCVSSDVRALRSMITQSNCSIKHLSLYINGIPSALDIDVRKIVDASPTVKHLTFDVIFAELNKEESLLDRLAGGQLHPHLEFLEFTYSGSYKFAFARIADCFNPNGKPGHIAIMHHRPLRYARIKFRWESRERLLGLASGDRHFLRLVQVKNSGFDLELLDRDGKDILQNFENPNGHCYHP